MNILNRFERKSRTLDKLEYAQTVIAVAHKKTLAGSLKWQTGTRYLKVTVLGKIDVMIGYSDVGPDSARWEYIMIDSPVGAERTMVGNPAEPKAKYLDPLPDGGTEMVDEIFNHVLLEPRHKAFAATIKLLRD